MLMQTFDHTGSVVVASNQVNRAARQISKRLEDVSKAMGQAETTVNQVPQDDQELRAVAITEIQQCIQGALIAIAWQGNAMGLKHLGFAKV
jgi:hypothetical protein